MIDSIEIGDRNVFALDLKDIYDYFGKVCITSNELMELWTNQISTDGAWWLSSASNFGPDHAWFVHGSFGGFSHNTVDSDTTVRPAFNIDLNKIDFSKV